MVDEEKRGMILEVSTRLVFHYGFQKTTMQDIAREAGISVGTLYNFFKSKEEIALACAERCKSGFIEMMGEVSRSSLPPDKKLREIMLGRNLAYHNFFKDTPHGIEIVTAILPKKEALIKKFEVMEMEIVEGVIREGCSTGLFTVADPQQTAETFITAFYRFCPPMSIGMNEDDIRRGSENMVDMLLSAMMK